MAGKTFRGVGEDGAPSSHIGQDDDSRPRLIDEDDTRGLHSGPTVVDDQKVAEVLKKLRSLDRAPGPLTGVTEVVVDGSSSEPTRLDDREIPLDSGPVAAARQPDSGSASLEDVMYPLKRLASVGRAATPTEGQPVTVPPGLARGTLFGHSIHVPDVNAPDAAEIELSSGGIQFLDGAPAALQPFPLADRPAVVVPPPTSQARLHAHTPYPPDQHTQLVDPPSRALRRFVAFVGGLSLAGAGIWAWWQYGGGQGKSTSTPPAVAAPVATPPAIDPMPMPMPMPTPTPTPTPTAPAAATPRAEPTAAVEPAPAPAAKPAAVPEPEPAAAAAPPTAAPAEERAPSRSASSPSRARRSRHAAERHAAAKPAAPADDDAEAAAGKPSPGHKKPAVSDDPDATMAPSGE